MIHQDGPDKYSVVENVKTLPRAKTMALDPRTHRLFLSTAEAGQFEVLVVGSTVSNETFPEIADCHSSSRLRCLLALALAGGAAKPSRWSCNCK